MERYANLKGDSAISSYEIGNNYILVEFISGSIYEYTYTSAGASNIETMKTLAELGSGLNSFINSYVKNQYSRKIKQ